MDYRKVKKLFLNKQVLLKNFLSLIVIVMYELKEFRRKNGLTQDQLGELLGMKKSYISKIENGKEELSREKLAKLLETATDYDTSMLRNVGERRRLHSTRDELVEDLRKQIEKLEAEKAEYWELIKKLTSK